MKNTLLGLIMISLAVPVVAQDQGKISVLVYSDYAYNIARDTAFSSFSNTALDGPEGYQAFQFRRIYFTYDHTFDETFSGRFRLEADEASLASNGKTSVFVKDANLKWKGIISGGDLVFGIQPTPAFQVSEKVWGYRSLEKTIMDLRGAVGSRDFGVGLIGKAGSAVGYRLLIANGTGNRPESDKYKRYYGLVELSPVSDFKATVYADYNDRSLVVNPYTAKSVSNSILTTAAFLGGNPVKALSVGLEGFLKSTSNGFNTGTALEDRQELGISAFAVWESSPELDVVLRYDFYDANTKSSVNGDSRNYILAALAWKVRPDVVIIPNLQVETYEQSAAGRSFDASLTGRLTVTWSFGG